MSRSGYTEYDGDDYMMNLYRGAVDSAIRGKRGQAMLVALVEALDAMPVKRLIAEDIETASGEFCALGALGHHKGIENLRELDPENARQVGKTFNIAESLAREVVFENDENGRTRWRKGPCPACDGWGERVYRSASYVNGSRIFGCGACGGTGRKHTPITETPEQRWARMRRWAASKVIDKSALEPAA